MIYRVEAFPQSPTQFLQTKQVYKICMLKTITIGHCTYASENP
jgi:hypothetical protein